MKAVFLPYIMINSKNKHLIGRTQKGNSMNKTGTTEVTAKTGHYVGRVDEKSVASFLGVRYAVPPKRWRRAESLPPSEERFEAFNLLDAAPQPIEGPDEWSVIPPMSEDCLWLNIWNNENGQKDKPVLVWIHGGSFMTGSPRFECMHGAYGGDLSDMAARHPDIVFVSIGFRVNLLGSIALDAFPDRADYTDTTDLIIYDMIEALKWIHENISAFSGNPDDVTIMGQSAGGWAVLALCVLPEANKYFRKAIPSSSGPSEYFGGRTKDLLYAQSQKTKEVLGVNSMAELLALPSQVLADKAPELLMQGVNFEPVFGGSLMPLHIREAWQSGIAKHITMLTGSVAGEMDTMTVGWSDEQIRKALPAMVAKEPALPDIYRSNYPDRDEITSLKDMLNDARIRCRLMVNVEDFLTGGGKAYVWYCDYMAENGLLRTQHVFDVVYVFNKLENGARMNGIPEPTATFEPNHKLQKEMEAAWMQFVKKGDPNCPEIGVSWLPYTGKERDTMRINRTWELVHGGIRPKDYDAAMQLHLK